MDNVLYLIAYYRVLFALHTVFSNVSATRKRLGAGQLLLEVLDHLGHLDFFSLCVSRHVFTDLGLDSDCSGGKLFRRENGDVWDLVRVGQRELGPVFRALLEHVLGLSSVYSSRFHQQQFND